MKRVFALLVGINDYPAPIPRLRGCVNDLEAMAAFLSERIQPPDAYLAVALRNEEATRDAVIAGFKNHLAKAGAGDVALFFFAGHGSQEPAPEEFWRIEPDRLNETLVCWDSRSADVRDLADKELAALIAATASRGAHVVVIIDSCHSGSATRAADRAETSVRRIEADLRPRPIGSFLASIEELTKAAGTRSVGKTKPLSTGRHVLLAACRDDEEAKEYSGEGAIRGAFSFFLGRSLREAGETPSYHDLFARTSALVRGQIQRQSPQLEATVADDLRQPFLGGAVRPRSRHFLAHSRDNRWTIDAGSVHGIPTPSDDAAEFGLFDPNASDDDLADPAKLLAKARVVSVTPTASQVALFDGETTLNLPHAKAVVTRLPVSRLVVRLVGDQEGIDAVRLAMAGSPFVREPTEGEAVDFRVIARDGRYSIAKPEDDRAMVEDEPGFNAESAKKIVRRLEHIERWKTTVGLANPMSSIGDDAFAVEIFQDGKRLEGPELRLEYTQSANGDWVNPAVEIRFTNRGNRTLFVAALDLPASFGIFPLLDDIGCQRLEPGQTAFASRGGPTDFTILDEHWKRGTAEIKDVVKVIVSTTEFDARRLAQEDLDLPRPPVRSAELARRGVNAPKPRGPLEHLMERVQTRHAGAASGRQMDDWRSFDLTFTTVRPLPAERLEPARGVALTGGVRIEPHPSLRAVSVRLTSQPIATRALSAAVNIPRLLRDDPAVIQPFELDASRSIGNVINVLEFNGVMDAKSVTPNQPLRVVVPRPLQAGEDVLPVAFDGEFFLPAGRAYSDGSNTFVELERLPELHAEALTPEASRSLGGAIRILFHKVVNRVFGVAYPYPILAAADIGADGKAVYQQDPKLVRERVAEASRIAVFVHGIIGDTSEMAVSLARSGVADRYALTMTFDYESLNDSIAATAQAFADRLASVGLGPGHGKTVDLIVHSMGGLVARWFIERLGGNKQVRRLVMLGTPNAGSPWPNVADWATNAIAVGLNGLSNSLWPAAALAWLVKAASRKVVTLEHMTPDSEFLKDLVNAPDPGIPYTVVVGNSSLIPAKNDAERGRVTRLLQRLWNERTKYELADQFFSGAENDIAVSVESMLAVPKRGLKIVHLPTACDHLTYFSSQAGLASLSKALTSGEPDNEGKGP